MNETKLPIVIFGAGIVGEALYYTCRDEGIRVSCFCDNNLNKTHSLKCGLEVLHTPDLKERYMDAVFLISSADIKDVIKQLKSLGFTKWRDCSMMLRNADLSKYEFSAPTAFVDYAVMTCLHCHDSYLNPKKIFLRSVDIIITERCSLKCKSCSNLMQYYSKPADCDIKDILKMITDFCSLIDEVNEFRVIGGEPFMNKQWPLAVKMLNEEVKVKKIVIYTNGTIVPSKENISLLKNEKVLVLVTDYGTLSKSLFRLKEFLESNGIQYYIQKAQGWTNCSSISRHNRTDVEQRELFRKCCAKNTFTLSDGKLFRCPFSANASRLKAVPYFREDYVNINIHSDNPNSLRKKRSELKHFLYQKNNLFTCDYCNGRSFGDPEIIPAIQTSSPIGYNIYENK